jgi:hypothetical protein
MVTTALLLALLIITVPAVPASAIPPAPHQFYGNVFVGGVAPASGTVTAKINGVQYATGTIDSQGRYGYATPLFRVPADNPDTPEKEGGTLGDTVQFFVGGIQAYQTFAFQTGGSTNLDLTVPGASTAPAVTSVAASNIASTTVTLNGNLTLTGSQVPVKVYFRYGTTTSYGMTTAPVSTSSTGLFSAYVTGLLPNTTYNFVAVAEGSSTVQATNNLTFTTLQTSITVVTAAATSVGTNSATLNGNLTSLGGAGAVEVYFRYGTNGTTWPYSTPVQGMSATGTFSYPVNALTYNTKYYFQAVAVFGSNLVTGSTLDFTTLQQGGSTSVNRFYGMVYVNGVATPSASIVAYLNGSATTPASATTADATGKYGYSPLFNVYGGPGTVTFRVNNSLVSQTATWTSGGVTQLDLFATPSVLTATTGSASWASAITATFNGRMVALGPTDTSAQLFIDWGTSPGSYTHQTAGTPSSTTSPVDYSITASPLSDGTTYYYQARVLGNGGGTARGLEQSYTHRTTPPTLVITTADPLPSGTSGTPYGPGGAGVTFAASGGVGPLTWSKTSGSLPTGLTLTGALLSGTPTADGTYTFTIHVTDGTNSYDKVFHITIGSAPTPCGSDPIGCKEGTINARFGKYNAAYLKYTATASTSITKINVKCSSRGVARVAIYTDNSGQVGTLLNANNASTAINEGVTSITIPSTAITAGTVYWLAVWTDGQIFGAAVEAGTYAYQEQTADFTFTGSPAGYVFYGGGLRGLISGSN